MNTKLYILLMFILWIKLDSIAQHYNDYEDEDDYSISDRKLKKLPWYGNNEFLYNYLDSSGYFNTKTGYAKAMFRIPVTLWVYRKSDGTEGPTDEEIKIIMNDLNYLNIKNNTQMLYYINQIKYINNSRRLILGYHLELLMLSISQREKGAINVHIAENIVKKRLFRRNGHVKGTYDKLFHTIYLKRVSSTSSLAHEIGHQFGLLHTHHNYNKGKCKQEAVDRSRTYKGCLKSGLICEKSGDAICDTPAEPNLKRYTNDSCEYIGKDVRDNWGDLYDPDTHNIMSYARNRACRTVFTLGQTAVMHYHAKKDGICAWDANCLEGHDFKHQYYFDKYEPDDTKGMATEIKFDQPQTHTFHKAFISKRKPDKDADVDWFTFKIKSKTREITIETAEAEFKAPATHLQLYDNGGKLIAESTKNINDDYAKLKVKNIEKGSYFLKVSKLRAIKNPYIGDYTIVLKENR